mgnify:CR=1 FL=1
MKLPALPGLGHDFRPDSRRIAHCDGEGANHGFLLSDIR